MSGIPQFNFPRFIEAAAELRGEGKTIISPAELDDEETVVHAMASPHGTCCQGHTWGDFLSRDVKIVADEVDGIILLDKWWLSKGARLEAYVGHITGKQFMTYSGRLLQSKAPEDILDTVYMNTIERTDNAN